MTFPTTGSTMELYVTWNHPDFNVSCLHLVLYHFRFILDVYTSTWLLFSVLNILLFYLQSFCKVLGGINPSTSQVVFTFFLLHDAAGPKIDGSPNPYRIRHIRTGQTKNWIIYSSAVVGWAHQLTHNLYLHRSVGPISTRPNHHRTLGKEVRWMDEE